MLNNFFLTIPNLSHKSEYERTMDKWEKLESNIQPSLMRRYSERLNANIEFEKWLEYCKDHRTTGSMLSTNVPCTLYFLLNSDS